jgi:thiol-disulfide isomerase/thioredoxin
MPIRALEKTHDSITLIWDSPPLPQVFELQMRAGEAAEWKTLSDKLENNSAKKKNLSSDIEYFFRVRCRAPNTESWGDFSAEYTACVLSRNVSLMAAPIGTAKSGSSLTLKWEDVHGAEGYRLRYRTDNGDWETVESVIRGTIAKKKSLSPWTNYYFSVRPVFVSSEAEAESSVISETVEYAYSPSSVALQVAVLSSNIASILPEQLLSRTGTVKTADVLAGKAVGIYFSASWCGPCRQYTPQLAEVYNSARAGGKDFEIVFCSADHSESDFAKYYETHHPWLAIPYNDSQRETLQRTFSVNGIPRLVILTSNGRVINDNAVQTPLGSAVIDSWCSSV